MQKSALNVFAGGALAGRLERSDRELDTVLFTYGEHSPAERAVSLTMPVRTDQYDASGGLLPIFEMRDTLALTLEDTKRFPSRDSLLRLMRNVTSKSLPDTVALLDRVAVGVGVAIAEARRYGKRHSEARRFSDRLVEVMTRGLARLGYKAAPRSGTESPI